MMWGLIGILLCSCVAHVAGSISTKSLLVQYGRSASVDPRANFVIHVPRGAICRVTVLRDDPLSQRNGFLVPNQFPCDFKLGEVTYSHLGSKFHTRDFIKFQIRVDTETETKITRVILQVLVLFTQMEIVLKNYPVTVPSIGGISNDISGDVLGFAYDPSNEMCHVVVLRMPRYGKLLNVTMLGPMGARYECSEFITSDIRYVHRNPKSSNRDYVTVMVEISDKEFNTLKREYFQIFIRILGANVNRSPEIAFQASNTLEVKGTAMGAVTLDVLAASDAETPEDDIIFNITQPLGPGEGELITLDDPYQPLTAFHQRDVRELKIAYRPPHTTSSDPRTFQLILRAIDSEGAASGNILFLIMVKPSNTNAPMVTLNAGLSLFEGQSRAITASRHLKVTDNDNFDHVRIQVIGGLRHGSLQILGNRITTFMATDISLDAPVVTYHHDNSETYSDSIIFRASDGNSSVDFVFPVTIAPLDDMAPILVYNTGLMVDEGGATKVDQYMMSAIDVDSDDTKIGYRILPSPSPTDIHSDPPRIPVGVFFLRQRSLPKIFSGWVLQDDGYYEKNVSQFLQSDLMENRLYYRHLGEEIFSDRVKFVLYDNAPRPNISPVQTFNIMISKIDDEPPRLANGASLVITVDEYGQKALTQDILRYTDTDSKDEELLYLTSPSKFVGGTNTSLPAGELVHADTGLPLLQFTQLQVNHGKILLKAPNMEMALLPRYAHIEFSVSDNSGNFIQNQTLRVFYKPLNNKPPEISLVPLTVSNQGVVALTKETIQVQDPDTPVNQLRVVISKLPQYGFLAWDGIQMALGDWFTTDDVRESRLTYQHNSQSREATDEVGLSVEDGAHKTPAILGILISVPRPNVTNSVLSVTLRVRENSQELIKLPNMSSIENNTVLLVTSPPRLGRIMRHGYEATKFNIRDLDSGMVSYQHTGGETGPGGGVDHFNLSCVDQSVMVMDDKRYHAVTAMALILPVDNQPPEINILRQLIVPEGSSTQVTQRHIAITDPDTRQRDVTCSIDVQPTHGFLENVRPSPGSEVSNAGKRVTSFSIRDLKEGHVNYVQSESAGVEPRMDWVAVSCTDGANTSPRKLISIAILPRNDEAPHLFTRDFVVREGGELVIDVTILNANDADKPMEELIFFVVTPPEHGIIKDTRLETGRNVSVFTLTQLQKSASIVYQHDGSETTRDSLTVRVTDGVHNTTKRIPIRIEQVDDEVPRLVVNVGVRLERPGESEVLTTSNLLATDLDSPDDNLTYIIRSTPRAGVLQRMRRDGTLQKLSLWGTFTQLDLRRRVIVYTQDPSIQTERDSFRFDITDGSNTLLNQVFYVFVRATDRLPPSVISREVKLNQGSRVLITTDYLTASDLQSDNTNLRYKLTRLPTQGHLELLNSPGIEVRTFSQLEVASNKLMYVHSSEEEIAGDSFDFEVSDGASSSVTRKFMITLLDVNNKKPVVTSQALKTREGGDVVITSFELRADDRDTSPENLRFTVTRVPLHGTLLKHGTPCQDFTQDDINKNHVKYLHDGSDTTLDDFLVTITDGAHYDYFLLPNTKTTQRTALRISIHITPVDNRLPQLVYNKGVRDLQVLATGKRGVRITGDTLRAEDPDSNNTELVYKVDTPPLNGFLTRDPATNKLLSKFTQGSLDRDGVYYVLSDSSNATSDMFTFDIVDPAGNTLPSQAFSLVWVWVSFERHFYLIDETSGFLEVVITRAGYLGATSTVRMSVTGITAVLREDFAEPVHSHVQFSPGQTRVLWRMRIIDDRRHEGNETLSLQLVSPRSCVISQFAHALVMIRDPEDVPLVQMARPQYVVEEGVGRVSVELQRTGDPSVELTVTCVTRHETKPGWATGTLPVSILSYSDFVMRIEGPSSVVTLEKGKTRAYCPVTIIDDTLYEPEEKFQVLLLPYIGSHVDGARQVTEVIISPDRYDEPQVFFMRPQYHVDESAGSVRVEIQRNGTDLTRSSSVFVKTRQMTPKQAEAHKDYVPIAELVYFAPHVTSQTVHVTLQDDTGSPRVEGEESFEIVLRMPVNTRLGVTHTALVTINDSFSDLPIVQFQEKITQVRESSGVSRVPLVRKGDLTLPSSVRCYTRQASARAQVDFTERADREGWVVRFAAGASKAYCEVEIRDDHVFEREERFRLVIRADDHKSRIGRMNETIVIITDAEDKPLILFTKRRIFVEEPSSEAQQTQVHITVQRTGDTTHASRVRVFTVDGTAKAGKDYQPLDKIILFNGSLSTFDASIQILYNSARKIRRAFSVRLLHEDEDDVTELGLSKAVIYIERAHSSAVTFPLPPEVVSLRHYDDVSKSPKEAAPGYPVICVTACDPKHSRYAETGSLCNSQEIDWKRTQYIWSVALPGQTTFSDVTSGTFFARNDVITLDSFYLTPGSRVRCSARAMSNRGELGLVSKSSALNVSHAKDGLCPSRDPDHVGSQLFTASIAFTGARGDGKANMVHIKVQIPHTDGMVPVISTRRFTIRDVVSPGIMRIAGHRCSNVVDLPEMTTAYGFLSDDHRSLAPRPHSEPYQYDSGLRGNTTVRFYRNLDMESCVWNFESFFDISELTQICGGSMETNEHVETLTQSQIALRVPLYVSYVYQSKRSLSDWLHYDHATFLRLTLVYDTAVLLKDGVQTPAGSTVSGSLWLTSIRIRDSDKKLVVTFKTKTKFRGVFLLKRGDSRSTLVSRDHPELSFTLKLIASQQTYESPEQRWQFVSDYAVKDYTGSYYVKLVPCMAGEDASYTDPPVCTVKDLITFNLPIRFQQIPDPVPAQFTLAVKFLLMSEKDLWMRGDLRNITAGGMDNAFTKDSKIYGLIALDQGTRPAEARGGYQVAAEKVYLCSGQGGFVPSYEPAKNKFGCLADSLDLIHRLKVLDRQTPDSVSPKLGSEPFEARFASDDPAARGLAERVDSDGFALNTAPLFQVSSGRKWFMHAVYSVSSDHKSRRTRSAEGYHGNKQIRHILTETLVHTKSRDRREASEVQDIGKNKGTNMRMIQLVYESPDNFPAAKDDNEMTSSGVEHAQSLVNPLVIGIAVLCCVLLVALAVVWTLYKRRGDSPQTVNAEQNDLRSDNRRGTAV